MSLKIALVQSQLVWENPLENRKQFAIKIASISEVDLIVLPEMFSTGFSMNPGNIDREEDAKTLLWMQSIAKEKGAAITGSILYKKEDKYFNRLFFVYPSGDYHYYNKRHSFSLAGEHAIYTAGKERVIIDYKGFKICPLICYDLRFPVWSRNTVAYDILLYVANWPAKRITAWDCLLQARAIENMAYTIGVNRVGQDANGFLYSGHSAVFDCLGKQLCFSDKETTLYATLEKTHILKTRERLGFLDDQDLFSIQE